MGETWIPREKLRAEVAQLLDRATPGPWEIADDVLEVDGESNKVIRFAPPGGDDIGILWADADAQEQARADAELIAAAPNALVLFLKLTEPRPLGLEFFETVRGDAGPDGALKVTRFWWRVRHTSNGEIVAQGEGYADRRDRDHIAGVLHPDLEPVEVDR